MSAAWTKPHHGVQHLKPVTLVKQATVQDRGDDVADARVWHRDGSTEEQVFTEPGAVVAAHAWCEQRATR